MTSEGAETATPFHRTLEAPVLGVGLGVDVFDFSPDYRLLIAEHRERFDFLEIYTRGDWLHCDHLAETIPATLAFDFLHTPAPR